MTKLEPKNVLAGVVSSLFAVAFLVVGIAVGQYYSWLLSERVYFLVTDNAQVAGSPAYIVIPTLLIALVLGVIAARSFGVHHSVTLESTPVKRHGRRAAR